MKTIVTTNGKVLQHGDDGLTIVSSYCEDCEFCIFDEVSDDETLNAFIRVPQPAAMMQSEEQNDPDGTYWEILRPLA